jgi:hypothetical protein
MAFLYHQDPANSVRDTKLYWTAIDEYLDDRLDLMEVRDLFS